MLRSGSTLPNGPPISVSKFPLAVRAEKVGTSRESITTLIPTAASCAWMNWASLSWSVELRAIRWTVGFGKPEAATSLLASDGLYGVHGMVASYHGLAGERGVQPGTPAPI